MYVKVLTLFKKMQLPTYPKPGFFLSVDVSKQLFLPH